MNLSQGQGHLIFDVCDLLLDLNLLFLLLFLLLAHMVDSIYRLLGLLIDIEVGGHLIFAHDCLEDHVPTSCRHLVFDDSLWVP